MSTIIKLDQLSPAQLRVWEAVKAYPDVELNDLQTLLDIQKTALKTIIYRLLQIGYLNRTMHNNPSRARGRKNIFRYNAAEEVVAIAYQKKQGIKPRKPRPSEIARRGMPKPALLYVPPERKEPAPVKPATPKPDAHPDYDQLLQEVQSLRRWKAFAVKLYPALNQPDEIFEAREILMRQYPTDARHREEIMAGKHDSGPAMQALLEVLARKG